VPKCQRHSNMIRVGSDRAGNVQSLLWNHPGPLSALLSLTKSIPCDGARGSASA
jgi:hypothetical protein